MGSERCEHKDKSEYGGGGRGWCGRLVLLIPKAESVTSGE